MKDKKSVNFKIAITGAFGALTIVLGITRWGFISLSPVVSLTIMHVPVILATLIGGLVPGLGVGLIFGIFSLIQAAMSPTGVLDPLFINPLISILPRMLIAVVTYYAEKLFARIPKIGKIVSGEIAAFVGSLSNTVFVIGALYIVYNSKMTEAMGNVGYFAGLAALMPNAILEAVLAVLITALVLAGIYVSSKKTSKLSEESSDDIDSESITVE